MVRFTFKLKGVFDFDYDKNKIFVPNLLYAWSIYLITMINFLPFNTIHQLRIKH